MDARPLLGERSWGLVVRNPKTDCIFLDVRVMSNVMNDCILIEAVIANLHHHNKHELVLKFPFK